MEPLLLLGVLSALLILALFVANQYGWLSNDGVWYDALNLVGASGLLYYAIVTDAVPFILTNGAWALVSGIDVLRYWWKRRR